MYRKKYKLKKKRKLINPYIIFLMFAISLLFVVYGYSVFSENLKITGQANIANNNGNHEYGNSSYHDWTMYAEWPGENGGHVYQVELHITNLDGDIESWELSFDVPDGCIVTNANLWQASEVTVSGNTVTMKSCDWNGFVANGDEIPLINLILPFDREVDFYLTNLTLNGKYVNLISNT